MRTPQRYPLSAVPDGQAYTQSLKPDMSWWQKALVAAAMGAIGTISSFVGSHWGGVTKDEMDKALVKQDEKLGERIDKAILSSKKDSDEMKTYVDAKVAAVVPPVPKKKRKPVSEE